MKLPLYTDRRQNPLHNRRRAGRAAGHGDIHRDNRGHAAAACVTLAEDAAVAAAIAEGDHELGFRHGVVSAPQRLSHMARDRAGHEQHVGVARGGDKLDAQTLQVVVRIMQRINFQLAAVARAGIDVADGERAAELAQDIGLQTLRLLPQLLVGSRRRLAFDAGMQDLLQYAIHGGLTNRVRYSLS